MSEYIVGGPFEHDDVFVANMGAERTHLYGYELREEIVRCRDCKFAIINSLGDCKYCEKFWDSDGDALLNLPGDFFCKWGERRSK